MSRDLFETSYVAAAGGSNRAISAILPGPPHRSTTMTPGQTHASAAQVFKPGTLYAVLLYRNQHSAWHWALYLPYDLPPPSSTRSLEDGLDVTSDDTEMVDALCDRHKTTKSTSTTGTTADAWYGNVWHCTNDNSDGLWAYEELSPSAINLPTRLVLAARLADLSSLGSPPEVALAVTDLLRHVPVRAEAHKSVFNCRTWMLDGIGELDDGGFLSCTSTMALERELVSAAQLATPKYEEDGSYVLITPRNCSDN